MTQTTISSFDEDLVRAISHSFNEPEWLERARLDALREFISSPPEKNPLYTKYVSTFDFPIEPFRMVLGRSQPD
ncbi:MAG TPA: hypothetical protein VGR56_03030, partial [Nitrososphaerales archaeon]|nr:hypothetical protein [Nitrososphaerales archaeon]